MQVITQIIFIFHIVFAEAAPEFNIRKSLRIPKYGNFQTLPNSTLNHKRISTPPLSPRCLCTVLPQT
jgi:hypothetical protein